MTSTNPITRRAVLAALPLAGIVVAQPRCVASAADASPELDARIEAHRAAYRAFVDRAVDSDLGHAEERALLAICAYPAVSQTERCRKVRYLLAIESRGELDLPEHMQAVLRSMV